MFYMLICFSNIYQGVKTIYNESKYCLRTCSKPFWALKSDLNEAQMNLLVLFVMMCSMVQS